MMVIICVLFALTLTVASTSVTSVQTKVAEIIGTQSSTNVGGQTYNVKQFLGIPYAKPPVGDLRFRKPEPVGEINSPFYATSYGYMCPQIYVHNEFDSKVGTEDEDCLYLNVFVPDQVAGKPSGHAVMIWIHGGAFILGAADDYDGKPLAAVGNVIIVTLNYRLGPLGFLSTMDEHCPGNMGLWDQRLAIQWVKDNIDAFGGDKDRITIFGKSAGAISSVLQGMYSDNRTLFQRIIAQSGVPSIRSMDFSRDTKDQVRLISAAMDCPYGGDTSSTIACLRTIPWKTFMETINTLGENFQNFEYVLYEPVVDGDFIKHEPKDIYKLVNSTEFDELNNFRQFDFLNGVNAFEGASFIPYYIGDQDLETFKPSSREFRELLETAIMSVFGKLFSKVVMDLVQYEYTDWSDPYNPQNIRLQYQKVLGDMDFAVPAVEYTRLHLAQPPVAKSFMYKFMPLTTNRQANTPSWIPGAGHVEEEVFVFGVEEQPNITDWEKELSLVIMRYWTNFAKTGNPNDPSDNLMPFWPEYDMGTQSYMELNKVVSNDSSKQFLYAKEAKFWLDILPEVAAIASSVTEDETDHSEHVRDENCDHHDDDHDHKDQKGHEHEDL